MGIHKLMSILNEKAPDSIKRNILEIYSGNAVACDASMAIYQFLVSTQGMANNILTELTDKEGNKTGHLMGLFNRTIMMLEHGLKPAWVFDGKPPKLKNGELAKRKKVKEESKEKMEDATDIGNLEEALKFKTRTVTITKVMKEDAIKMLRLMGIPVIEAPCEAESQCAALCKAGKVFATVSEDLDSLTFGSKILLRGLNSKKEPITEISYDEMLKGLELTHEEFVDMCILCGCDYTETVDGVGPVTAYKLIKQHKNIEEVIKHLEKENEDESKKKKYRIPANFYYEDSRELFFKPEVTDPQLIQLKWNKPDEEELKKFLVDEKGFALNRVESGIRRILGSESKGHQSRIESFFGKPTVVKRKPNAKETKASGKKQIKKH